MPPPSQDEPTLRQALQELKRLLHLIRPHWGALSKGLVLGPVAGLIGMIPPYLTKLLIDEVYPTQDIPLMYVLVGALLAVGCAAAITKVIHALYMFYVASRVKNDARLYFFNHLQHLSTEFFTTHKVGEVTSRFRDVGRALHTVTRVSRVFFTHGIYLIIVPPFLVFLEWRLALVVVVTLPISFGIVLLAGKRLRRQWRKTSEAYADLSAMQVETLTHIRTLRPLGIEHHVYREAQSKITSAMSMEVKAGSLRFLVRGLNQVLQAILIAGLAFMGWTFILDGTMTLGSYVAFIAYLGFMTQPLQRMVELFSDFQHSAVNLRRMFEYLDADTEQDPSHAYEPRKPIRDHLNGAVHFSNVGFRYGSSATPVLQELNLDVEAGTSLSIVGASGSGKTTLLRLLTQLETPCEGQILLDGRPLSSLRIQDVRRQISVVWQDHVLISGTIRDNLTLGTDGVDDTRVRRALRTCRMLKFVESLPDGLDTPVAEGGASLSGGQQQRLALARALVRDASIVVLDEVTSNLDRQTEAAILGDLLPQLESMTVFFVTHRIDTARKTDQICVIDEGRVAQVGRHHDLARNCEAYASMLNASDVPPVSSETVIAN